MFKLKQLCSLPVIFFAFLLIFPGIILAEETITITTYYPSPYGVYREMRAKRIAIGDTYYDAAEIPWEEADADGGEIDYLADLVVEGNVGIGTTNPNANAILDISSTTKAIMLPRMTTVQRSAISPPAAGMVVYDTTEAALYTHNGSTWVKQGGGGGCYVSYSGSCLTGFTNEGSAGTWGVCTREGVWAYDPSGAPYFRPPGGACLTTAWTSYSLGTAYICCKS
jgi:hypothetical protein